MKKILLLSSFAVVALFILPGCPDREVVRVSDRPVVVERRTDVVVRQPEGVRVEERR